MRDEITLEFAGAVVDEQAYLDGTREYAIEAESEGSADAAAPWRLTLTFRWPKEEDAALEEGDLTLIDPTGSDLYAALRAGTAASVFDEETGAEAVQLDLRFEVNSGEGSLAAGSGVVHLAGTLRVDEARLTARLSVEA